MHPHSSDKPKLHMLPGRFLTRLTVLVTVLGLQAFFWPATPSFAYKTHSTSRATYKKVAKKKVPKKRHKRKYRKKTSKRHSKRVEAKAVYCVDLKRKKTLLARNADKTLPIASLTKLVTALVTLERLPLKRKVTVPKNIRRVPKSVVGLRPGDRVSVRDLLHGLLIRSGNDCAETLASAYPGGRKAFIKAMNHKVRKMGTRHTRFYTPSGLDSKIARKINGKKSVHVRSNVSTAREMARITRIAFSNRTIRTICRKKSHVIASAKKKGGYRVRNTNKLLRSNLPLVGGKTGYTNRAGHCLASAFTPGRNVFLIVVLGSPDHFRDTRLVYRKALKKTAKDNVLRRRRAGKAHERRLALHKNYRSWKATQKYLSPRLW
jgi:D-alanyl-D-alanine carboxypeptidase